MDQNEDYKWYILYVMVGQEHQVKRRIEDIKKQKKYNGLIKEVLVPIATKIIVEQNKKKESIECIFSSYVFVHANLKENLHQAIVSLLDVFKFLGNKLEEAIKYNPPLCMTEKEVESIFNTINQFKETDNYLYFQYSIGDYVRITNGVFKNYRGRIKSIQCNKVSIESEFLNAADIREIPIHTIEKIDVENIY